MLAQEAERTEIARDLHDDISQQLAALGIGLSLLEARVKDQDRLHNEVVRLRQMASGLAEKIRHVSHSLHPGVLKHAGLHAAIASHCEAVDAQHPFQVSFEARGTFNDLTERRRPVSVPRDPAGAAQRGDARERHSCLGHPGACGESSRAQYHGQRVRLRHLTRRRARARAPQYRRARASDTRTVLGIVAPRRGSPRVDHRTGRYGGGAYTPRLIPSLRRRLRSVLGLSPRSSAAPRRPSIRHSVVVSMR